MAIAAILSDMVMSLDMMFGNARGIANAMLEGATIPEGASREELAEQFAKLMNERYYNAGVNLKQTEYTQGVINSIMKELGIIPDAGNSNLMKATLQRIETNRAINNACKTSSSRVIDIKDLAQGLMKSFKASPLQTIKNIMPTVSYCFKNPNQAMRVFFQMILKA